MFVSKIKSGSIFTKIIVIPLKAQQVEKALSKVEKDLHIETLKRAATTTPLIEGRSIGSDILNEARINDPSNKKDKDDAINKIRSPDKIIHLNQTAFNSSSRMVGK